ncbi:YraN family protein [Homoserinibacter sp. YIM 151385]|uniref:YraN family protein n=1 Tax=Homoserinibacter sp. YIM 151385 TaxID=2985506 RepID=UPI0022EFDCC6|nr:YraN family protein [Homoserinibacter sp. YIM 151385]WBU39170.1 YraN family protein [Homoserinibacter sp. YIM 151385]
MAAKDDLGRLGEELAARHLRAAGMEVVARNWRCRHGEIDLVVRDGPVVAIVEVKTRSGLGFGHPLEAITVAKLRRLRRLAGLWSAEHGHPRSRMRLDAVSVIAPRDAPARIEHIAGIG